MQPAPIQPGSVLVLPSVLHAMARSLRACALGLRDVSSTAATTGRLAAEEVPGLLTSGAQALVDAARRAIDAEAEVLTGICAHLDAAAQAYVAQEQRLADALGS